MNGTLANWLPPAVRQGPGGASDPERLLDVLLAAVDQQAALLARDVDQVYDDVFVESCADWAVPYIGSLLGLPADASRLEVANAIALRRRKGTPAALEDFAEVVSGWVARATEGWQVTACVQQLGHPGGHRPTVFDLSGAAKRRIGGPFDRSPRVTATDRGIAPNGVRVAVWPWTVRTHHDTEAAPSAVAARFHLHPLAAESPLYVRPSPLAVSRSPGVGRTEDETDAPVRVTYQVLEALAAPGDIDVGTNWTIASSHPLADTGPSADPPLLRISVVDAVSLTRTDVPWSSLRFGSLPTGAAAPQSPAPHEVVVDINRGAVELGSDWQAPVRATWHRAVSGELGALAGTSTADARARVVVTVNPDATPGPTVRPTLTQAVSRAEALSVSLDPADSRTDQPDVEVRLLTSARLTAPNAPVLAFTPTLPRWRIVAPTLLTPTVVGNLTVDLAEADVTLEGFAVTGDVVIGSQVREVRLQNLTMDPVAGSSVSVDPQAWGVQLSVDRSVLGPVRADLGARAVRIANSVVDGVGVPLRMCGAAASPAGVAAVAASTTLPPMLWADAVTFHGTVEADAADATDCIFVDGLHVQQTQMGCVRFSHIADSAPADLPTTYQCVASPSPTFASVGFDSAEYFALRLDRPSNLHTASSSGGGIGAYAHARGAARLARLRQRVDEFVPLMMRSRVAVQGGEAP